MTASYLAVVRLRPARRLLYALSAACVAFGMVGLTLLLTVERSTRSYSDGGFAVALFSVMAGVMADRLRRQNFFLQRATERQAAELRELLDRVRDPRTFTTWEQFERFHKDEFVARAEALVARVGS